MMIVGYGSCRDFCGVTIVDHVDGDPRVAFKHLVVDVFN